MTELFPPSLTGRGEMRDRIRDFDWSTTALGPIESWPSVLAAAVELILHSDTPMLVAWGPEYLQIYNDGYVPILGARHPAALGRRAEECWAEDWETLRAAFDRLSETEATAVHAELSLGGDSGEERFALVCGAIHDGGRRIGGVLMTALAASSFLEPAGRMPPDETVAATLRRSEERLRAMVERSWDGIILAGRGGEILYVSPSVGRILGYSADELTGQRGTELIHPEDRAAAARTLELCAQTPNGVVTMEHRSRRKDGSWRWLEVVVTNLLEHAAVGAFVVNFRDVTERRQAEEESQRALRVRNEMMAVLSHDLRNPLNAMGIIANLLLAPSLREERRRDHALTLNRLVTQMGTLIANLLDLAAIETGTLNVAPRREDVAALVGEAVDSMQPLAVEKSVRLRVDLPADLPEVSADRRRILQVVSEVLENAIEFTPEAGEIVLRAKSLGDRVEFSVQDTGCGIPADDIAHVFDRFWRKKRAGVSGAGLGLAIVKGLVEAHGGTVSIDSAEGRGTTFSFTLPVAAPAELLGTDDDVSETRH